MNAAMAESLFAAARIIHIGAGVTALFVGPGAMLTVKGARWHRLWGKIFVGAMATVAATAIPMAFYHPNPFLQMVAVFSFYLAFSGWRMLRRRRDGTSEGTLPISAWGDAALCTVAFLGSLALLASGAQLLIAGNTLGTVPLVFSGIGIVLSINDGRDILHPQLKTKGRISAHIGRMGGAYIATVTAFFVVNIHFMPSIVVWLLPTLLGVPLIIRSIRAHKKRSTARSAAG